MKRLLMLLLAFPGLAVADDGITNVVFCRDFAVRVHWGMRMAEVTKIAKTNGMEVSPGRWHWDGGSGSYLNIQSYDGVLKSGLVTCPNGDEIPIGHTDG